MARTRSLSPGGFAGHSKRRASTFVLRTLPRFDEPSFLAFLPQSNVGVFADSLLVPCHAASQIHAQ
jgi:hypothetical protein